MIEPDQFLRRIRAREKVGEFFLAYDIARRGIEAFPRNRELRYRAVLVLARAGATELAVRKYLELKLDRARDIDSRSLYPRLMKDRALAAPLDRRPQELAAAAILYEKIYRETADSFPGINAATLFLLAGNVERAARIAQSILSSMERVQPPKNSECLYWYWATITEAQLVVGDIGAAASAAKNAISASRCDFAMLASTGRQLALIAKARGFDISWIDGFRPRPVIHYTGHRIAPPGVIARFPSTAEHQVKEMIREHLGRLKPTFGYGSLAGGADILVAEALLDFGADLHVILPFQKDEFVELSVRSCGPGWVRRFNACMEAASDVRYASDDAFLGDDTLFTYASRYAMGLAVLRAHRNFALAHQLAVWDGAPSAGSAGTSVDVAIWRKLNHGQTVIAPPGGSVGGRAPGPAPRAPSALRRRARAMLFGDIKGFSKLTDSQLPAFVSGVMGAMAKVLDKHRKRVLLVNTWGDGLFVVFKRAHEAADCALALQEELAGLDFGALGLPSTLALRLGGHVGPVYAPKDPIIKKVNFFGAHVSQTARIEPITPPHSVYVTETFAASVELEHSDRFACEYVGITEMAKGYGRLRMFLLRRRGLA